MGTGVGRGPEGLEKDQEGAAEGQEERPEWEWERTPHSTSASCAAITEHRAQLIFITALTES